MMNLSPMFNYRVNLLQRESSMFSKAKVAILGGALVATSMAQAGEIVISQKGKVFSEKQVIIQAGDSISFVNDDDITHNVYSRSKGHKFDIGAQRPGTTVAHQFNQPGKAKVRCAIHPRMKLTVNVE